MRTGHHAGMETFPPSGSGWQTSVHMGSTSLELSLNPSFCLWREACAENVPSERGSRADLTRAPRHRCHHLNTPFTPRKAHALMELLLLIIGPN